MATPEVVQALTHRMDKAHKALATAVRNGYQPARRLHLGEKYDLQRETLKHSTDADLVRAWFAWCDRRDLDPDHTAAHLLATKLYTDIAGIIKEADHD
jgi:hypothetical protein